MKIAILTFPLHVNYGGILQCYALQVALRKMGYEVEVIQWSDSFAFTFCDVFKGIVIRVLNKLFSRKGFVNIRLEAFVRHRKIVRFIKENISFTKDKYYSKSDLEQLSYSDYDVIVVGSDQIWRNKFVPDSWIDVYFLSFLKGQAKKRIAYSVSFGVDYAEYSAELARKCREYISLFDAVSVREDSGLDLIKNYHWQCRSESVHTLDPTMLLSKDDYLSLLHLNVRKYKSSFLFTYLLDVHAEADCIQEQIISEKGWNVEKVELIDRMLGYKSLFVSPSLSPVQWLEYIAASQFVVTDSFHGCVFSILLHKPFIVLENVERGNARISSLLRLVRLESRRVLSLDDFKQRKQALLAPVDYESVESILQVQRELSLRFLRTHINK